MGEEITRSRFSETDFQRFTERLTAETQLLADWIQDGTISDNSIKAGFELEAWLVDSDYAPAPVNSAFLKTMDDPLVTPELARFNVELNIHPKYLMGQALSVFEEDLKHMWGKATQAAQKLNTQLLMIGILPTLQASQLNLDNMSDMKRYHALNEQVLRLRQGRPIELDIIGVQHLQSTHHDVMLESATTSFQIHIQVPVERAHHYYNAAIAISAPMIAACANSPYLFAQDLWDETRIPLFEQSVDVAGFGAASQGPVRRASLGSGYARHSIMECFEENLQHFPVLLPNVQDKPVEGLHHLCMHNGTIWRWNRPLLGFDNKGKPHIRIEHRVLPACNSIVDAIATAAFFYGLIQALYEEVDDFPAQLAFTQARDNFYQAARYGLQSNILWLNDKKIGIRELLLQYLIPMAHKGLNSLGIEASECDYYLNIIRLRVETGQNGCNWQRQFVARHGSSMQDMTAAYLQQQQSGLPVHEWRLE